MDEDSLPLTDAGDSARWRMFRAALISRSCGSPHSRHVHRFTRHSLTPWGPLSDPPDEQVRRVFVSLTTGTLLPVCWPLYCRRVLSIPHPQSSTDFAILSLHQVGGYSHRPRQSALTFNRSVRVTERGVSSWCCIAWRQCRKRRHPNMTARARLAPNSSHLQQFLSLRWRTASVSAHGSAVREIAAEPMRSSRAPRSSAMLFSRQREGITEPACPSPRRGGVPPTPAVGARCKNVHRSR
jgi:hypothetical protein